MLWSNWSSISAMRIECPPSEMRYLPDNSTGKIPLLQPIRPPDGDRAVDGRTEPRRGHARARRHGTRLPEARQQRPRRQYGETRTEEGDGIGFRYGRGRSRQEDARVRAEA